MPDPSCPSKAMAAAETRLGNDAGQRADIGVSRRSPWGGKN